MPLMTILRNAAGAVVITAPGQRTSPPLSPLYPVISREIPVHETDSQGELVRSLKTVSGAQLWVDYALSADSFADGTAEHPYSSVNQLLTSQRLAAASGGAVPNWLVTVRGTSPETLHGQTEFPGTRLDFGGKMLLDFASGGLSASSCAISGLAGVAVLNLNWQRPGSAYGVNLLDNGVFYHCSAFGNAGVFNCGSGNVYDHVSLCGISQGAVTAYPRHASNCGESYYKFTVSSGGVLRRLENCRLVSCGVGVSASGGVCAVSGCSDTIWQQTQIVVSGGNQQTPCKIAGFADSPCGVYDRCTVELHLTPASNDSGFACGFFDTDNSYYYNCSVTGAYNSGFEELSSRCFQ